MDEIQRLQTEKYALEKLALERAGQGSPYEKLNDVANKLVDAVNHMPPPPTVPVLQRGNPVIRGSITRAKAWTAAIQHPNAKNDISLPEPRHLPAAPNNRGQLEERVAQVLSNYARPEEKDIDYVAVVNALVEYFGDLSSPALGKIHVLDTHRHRFLDDMAPDLVLQRASTTRDKFNVAVVIDLKGLGSTGHDKIDTAQNLGQVLDYIVAIEKCQPGRTVFLGILTNLRDAYLVRYQTSILKGRNRRKSANEPHTHKLECTRKVPLGDALQCLYHDLRQPQANPPKLPFSKGAGELSRLVQRRSKSVVGVFNRANAQIIVKAAPTIEWNSGFKNEILILRALQGPGRPASIPSLIYDNLEDPYGAVPPTYSLEFGISPAGRPLQLELFDTANDFRACLGDVLVAIMWVHNHNIIHRDIRPDNVIVFMGPEVGESPESAYGNNTKRRLRGMLIDFDRATEVGKVCEYEGGYICCPPDLLRQCTAERIVEDYEMFGMDDELDLVKPGVQLLLPGETLDQQQASSALSRIPYTPERCHDYLAFVLLVNTVVFPFTLQSYTYHHVEVPNSPEQLRLLRLWGELEMNQPWASLVDAAQRAESDAEVWRELLGLLVWL